MRRWGILITAFYALLLVVLVTPVGLSFAEREWNLRYGDLLQDWTYWVVVSLFTLGQGLLLFISVDTSWRKVRPRQHILVSAALTGILAAVLALALMVCVLVTIPASASDVIWAPYAGAIQFCGWLFGLWIAWAAVFYRYYRKPGARLATGIAWLLRGSVLELLVAVPAHVIVRRRDECCAPTFTGWGIATGIAVMLACFGPGVLVLYQKQMESYRKKRARLQHV